MRVDGKPEGLRQSMSWLHTWSGLVLGWLLFAVFFTGTLSYFRTEIDAWMHPEIHTSVPSGSVTETAQMALDKVQRMASPEATSWTLSLPNARRTTVDASWREPTPPGTVQQGRGNFKRVTLDATTGEQLEPRETRGGGFLYRFHFELYAMPRIWGRWIVGIATMLMFVAIISGVITHKKIFTDFFTFRPKKGQRSWLDSHNATAVLALPFHILITFSGLLLLINPLMPWTSQSVNGGVDPRGGGRQQAAPAQTVAQANGQRGGAQAAGAMQRTGEAGRGGAEGRPQGGAREGRGEGGRGAEGRAENRGEGGRGEGRGEGRRARNDTPEIPEVITLAPIGPMLAEAMRQWPENGVGSITVNDPNTPKMTVDMRENGGSSFVNRGQTRTLQFNGITGELRERPDNTTSPTFARATYNVVTGIHMARGADSVMRWLLFLSGVVGTFMAASGMVLYVVKRLPERKKLGYTPFGHKFVEVLNVGAIAGLPVATAVYFWANRLIPAGLEARSDWEIRCFFTAWLLCFLHPLLRVRDTGVQRRTWLEQMAVAAVLFALLPILNPLTGGASLASTIPNGQWLIAGFDLMMLALSALMATVVWWLLRGKPAPKAAAKAAPKAAPKPAAARGTPEVAVAKTSVAATAATAAAVVATAAVAAGTAATAANAATSAEPHSPTTEEPHTPPVPAERPASPSSSSAEPTTGGGVAVVAQAWERAQ